MKTPSLLPTAVLALAGFAAGCATDAINARIAEKSAVFNELNATAQKNIREGTIEPGYTADMVYMALGSPSKVQVRDTAQGKIGIWVYNNFYPEGYVAADQANAAGGEKSVAAAAAPAASTPAAASSTSTAPAAASVASDTPKEPTPGTGNILGPSVGKSYWAHDRGGQKAFQANASTFSARSAAMEPLDIPDLDSAALYVVFFEGHVVKMTLRHN